MCTCICTCMLELLLFLCVGKSKSQQDLKDIFESSVSMEVSPSVSRMSSTNPSKENSRASSPSRTESRNSISDIEIDKGSSSIPVEDTPIEDTPDNIPFIPVQSQSFDPVTSNPTDMLLPRRQSVDLEVEGSSRLGIQTPSAIISKVKSMASNQQEKTGRKVKELFSSLSSQAPTVSGVSGSPLTSMYTPLAAATGSPPPSNETVSIGVIPPSPEMGVLPDNEDNDHHSNLISPESSPVPDIETERFVAFTTEAMLVVMYMYILHVEVKLTP